MLQLTDNVCVVEGSSDEQYGGREKHVVGLRVDLVARQRKDCGVAADQPLSETVLLVDGLGLRVVSVLVRSPRLV